MGSIFETRSVGKKPARPATAVRIPIIARKVTGSLDVTPKRSPPSAVEKSHAVALPISIPILARLRV
jgi:hypothetical protein